MMGWYGGGMGPLGWSLMGLFWLVLIGLIVWLVVRLLPSGGQSPQRPPVDSPEEILDRRFALGEIDEATYQAQRAALSATHGDRRVGQR